MDIHQFQVTLPSNASINHYPQNKPNCYTTRLPDEVSLLGEWEVAIVDIQYPYRWKNVPKTVEYSITLQHSSLRDVATINFYDLIPRNATQFQSSIASALNETKPANTLTKFIDLQAGFYESVQVLGKTFVTAIKNAFKDKVPNNDVNPIFEFDKITQRGAFSFGEYKAVISASNINGLLIFGWEPDDHLTIPRAYEIDKYRPCSKAPRLSLYKSIFVYSDIQKLQIVGDTRAALLGVAPVQGVSGEQNYFSFNPTFYMPLRTTTFGTIDIELYSETGDPIPIYEGLTVVRLQFRKQKV